MSPLWHQGSYPQLETALLDLREQERTVYWHVAERFTRQCDEHECNTAAFGAPDKCAEIRARDVAVLVANGDRGEDSIPGLDMGLLGHRFHSAFGPSPQAPRPLAGRPVVPGSRETKNLGYAGRVWRGVRAAEGTRLEIAYLPKGGSRVRIPPSPLP
jgi:hypothetical protein